MAESLDRMHEMLGTAASALLLCVDADGKLGYVSHESGPGHVVAYSSLLNKWANTVLDRLFVRYADMVAAGTLLQSAAAASRINVDKLRTLYPETPDTQDDHTVKLVMVADVLAQQLESLTSAYLPKEEPDATQSLDLTVDNLNAAIDSLSADGDDGDRVPLDGTDNG